MEIHVLGHIKNISCFGWSDRLTREFPGNFWGVGVVIFIVNTRACTNIFSSCAHGEMTLLLVELVYVFERTQAVSSVLPKICTENEEGCLILGAPKAFVSITK